MKRIIACIMLTFLLTACLCGCARNDGNAVGDTGIPVVTTSPNLLPKPDNGTVTDGDGIIERAEEDVKNDVEGKDDGKNDVTATPSASPSASPEVSASPAVSPNT